MANVAWELDYETWEQYAQLIPSIHDAHQRGDAVQASQLTDQLRSLPGYPMGAHPVEDKIVPVIKRSTLTVVSKPRRLVTL